MLGGSEEMPQRLAEVAVFLGLGILRICSLLC